MQKSNTIPERSLKNNDNTYCMRDRRQDIIYVPRRLLGGRLDIVYFVVSIAQSIIIPSSFFVRPSLWLRSNDD